MALDDCIGENWAEFLFERILSNAKRNVAIAEKRIFGEGVCFGLKNNHLIEVLLGLKDEGEDLLASDFILAMLDSLEKSKKIGTKEAETDIPEGGGAEQIPLQIFEGIGVEGKGRKWRKVKVNFDAAMKNLDPLTQLDELTPLGEVSSKRKQASQKPPTPKGCFGGLTILITVKPPPTKKRMILLPTVEQAKEEEAENEKYIDEELTRFNKGKLKEVEQLHKRNGDDFDPWARQSSSMKPSAETRKATTLTIEGPTAYQDLMPDHVHNQLLKEVMDQVEVEILVDPQLAAQ